MRPSERVAKPSTSLRDAPLPDASRHASRLRPDPGEVTPRGRAHARSGDARDAAAAHRVLRGLGARDTPGRTQVPHGQVRGDSTRVERGRLAQRENPPETIAQGDAGGDTPDALSRVRATGVDQHAFERRNQKDWFPDGRTTLGAVAGEHGGNAGVRARRVEHASRPTESGVSDCGCVRRRERDVPTTDGPFSGGTHHAYRDRGEGFCVFNDIAVAINVVREEFRIEKSIVIIDVDVHQGNGSAKIFEDDDQVVTFSMHGEKNYPIKTREKSTHDVELPDDAGDDVYLGLLGEWLPRLFDDYDPALVFFQAGVDALREDSFGRLAMTRQGMLRRNNAVYSMCIERDVPLVITMGGGYSRPIGPSLDAHVDVFRSAALRYTAPAFPDKTR